ncbi:peptidoglycan-binding domain-containing protein [Yinghuangia sp. YIM S09857]|uniref:peptidoglycan-binding domain-containing protein n=1 Tax=Yinghuangia sp. YIM S09857 TaxID=3436929 RepID=UPI003F5359ED
METPTTPRTAHSAMPRLAAAAAAALLAVGASGSFAPAHAAPGLPGIGPGATGFGAQCVQAFYHTIGFSDFYPDAVYGPETTADTRRFERLLGLPQDGVVDPVVGSVMHTVVDLGSGEGAWKTVGCWYEVPSLW